MSSINPQDQELIRRLKQEIEAVSRLPIPEKWTQKDYDFLVYFIEEKSGVRISLSTLKRIWKNENNRLPHIATLDALSQVAYNKKWLSLKTDLIPNNNLPAAKKPKRYHKLAKLTLGCVVVFALLFSSYKYLKKTPENLNFNTEEVSFSARTSLDNEVPNSVLFDYDVSNIDASKFYIQQNWDTRRRVEISKENKTQTDIYYEPGLYNTKLIADSTILAEIPVHIKTNDWFLMGVVAENKEYYTKKQWLTNGMLGVSKANLAIVEAKKEEIGLVLYNSREFHADGDNFKYNSSFQMEPIPEIQCPKMAIILKGEHDYFIVQIVNKGCESDAFFKLSEKEISGKNNDLTMLGADVYEWQNIQVHVENKALTIMLNRKEIYKNHYDEPIGALKEITHIFYGWGAIDNVQLTNANDSITYANSFD
ncbi:MAG: hypothetical protein COA50_03995 [Flavobacteriaceae bacterium]|nr:MAG: hypothetical protein COA50_03995 [Flavobacteriaceae bacterium]